MRFSAAIIASVAAHGLVAVGIVAYMKYAPGPTAIATLDLSSVDLSFAEDEDETAAVSPTMPAMPEVEPPKPREENPPEAERAEDPLPPDPEAPKLAEPDPTELIPEQAPARPARESTSDEVAQAPSTAGSAAQAPKQAKIDAPPKPHKTIKPDYPKGARQRGEQGDVVLEIRVNAAGIVDRVDIVSPSGFPELDEAAVRAARAARFTPAKSGGSAVASTARLTLTFKLK
ncbi:MAG: TonB family protein [Kiritimatiellae bacterium]|nr:TonB family protein [Kiritimatiellia bacterium]